MSRKPFKPKAVGTLIEHNEGVLRHLITEIARQTFLLHHLKQVLPSPMRPHLVAVRLRDRVLVLYADSSAWMTRIRFQAPQLVKHVPPQFGKPLQTKLRIATSATSQSQRRERLLSPAATRTLLEAASGTPDQDLKAAVERLGSLRHKNG